MITQAWPEGPWGREQGCAFRGREAKGSFQERLQERVLAVGERIQGLCWRCKTVGGQWGAQGSGWGGADSDYPGCGGGGGGRNTPFKRRPGREWSLEKIHPSTNPCSPFSVQTAIPHLSNGP